MPKILHLPHQIRDAGGRVFYGIDATRLEQHYPELADQGEARPQFDKIVFHFPHTGGYIGAFIEVILVDMWVYFECAFLMGKCVHP